MPVTKTTVTVGAYDLSYRTYSGPGQACYPAYQTIATASSSTYDSYYKQYNSPAHRLKPDPLTDTGLALQFTRRCRLSVIAPFFDWSEPAYCLPAVGTLSYWKQQKSSPLFETSGTIGTNWSAATLRQISKEYVNLGSSLAEYRETGRMFSQFASGVRKAWSSYRDLRKGNLSGLGLTPCSVPAAELAYSFGVKPLAEDLFSAAESLRLRMGLPVFVRCVNTTHNHKVRDVRSTPWELSQHSYAIEKEYVSNRVNLSVQLYPLGVDNISIGNPSIWAWELIPFSFVVDWGIPIGQWLEDLDMLTKVQCVKGTQSRKIRKVVYFKIRVKRQSGAWYTNASLGKTSYKSHERWLISSLPVPKLPKWSPSSTYHRVYRAVSLLISVNQPCRKYSGRKRHRLSR